MKICINIENCSINNMEMYQNNCSEETEIETTGSKIMLKEGLYLKSSSEDGKNLIITAETEEEASFWILTFNRNTMKTTVQEASTGMYWTFVPQEQGKEIQLLPQTDDCNYVQRFNAIYTRDGYFSLLDESRRFVSYSKLPPVAGEVIYAEKEDIFVILMTTINNNG